MSRFCWSKTYPAPPTSRRCRRRRGGSQWIHGAEPGDAQMKPVLLAEYTAEGADRMAMRLNDGGSLNDTCRRARRSER